MTLIGMLLGEKYFGMSMFVSLHLMLRGRSSGFSDAKQWLFEVEHMALRGRRYTSSVSKVHFFGIEYGKVNRPNEQGKVR